MFSMQQASAAAVLPIAATAALSAMQLHRSNQTNQVTSHSKVLVLSTTTQAGSNSRHSAAEMVMKLQQMYNCQISRVQSPLGEFATRNHNQHLAIL
jgi:glycerol-3-phosphate O-acyltransferase